MGGCTDPEACNFDSSATADDGSCEFESCAGCLQSSACNYDPEAIYSDGSCEFPDFGYNCAGECLNDTDGDGVCNPFEVLGCQDMTACNYNPEAIVDDGSCAELDCLGVCGGNAIQDDVCGACVDVDAVLNAIIDGSSSEAETVLFVKENYASNSSENWDWISDDVALFRNSNQGLFNAVSQNGWQENITGTLWGPPGTTDLSQFTSNWRTLQCNLYNDCSYSCNLPGNSQTLYIQSTGDYYLIEYSAWTCGNNGGGFSYQRTKLNLNQTPVLDSLQTSLTLLSDTIRFEFEFALDQLRSYYSDILRFKYVVLTPHQIGLKRHIRTDMSV